MISLEQAVLIADPTVECGDYHLAAASSRLGQHDVSELIAWGPLGDQTSAIAVGQWSLNFHPLPSGAYAISRTTLLGGAAGSASRVYTQALIADAEAMTRFACNPFALLRAVMASNPLGVYGQIPSSLPTLHVAGRATAVDQVLLARLAFQPGPRWMSRLMQSALDCECVVITGSSSIEALISGLISCLPPECRTVFSFTTGLGFSPHHPFRIVGHAGGVSDLASLTPCCNFRILDLSGPLPDECNTTDGWARLLEQVLTTGCTPFLASQLSTRRAGLQPNDLSDLGWQLLEYLDDSVQNDEPTHVTHKPSKNPETASMEMICSRSPSKQLQPDSPEVLEKLETLDDAVFEFVAGDQESLGMLKTLWPQVCNELGEDLIAESREQYLRYAMSVWDEHSAYNKVCDPSRALRAMDLLCVLFDRV